MFFKSVAIILVVVGVLALVSLLNVDPKKLTEADMKIMYQHSMSGELFK